MADGERFVFLFHDRGAAKTEIYTANAMTVRPREIRRASKERLGGIFTISEHAGWDRSQLDLRFSEPMAGDGFRAPPRTVRCSATARGVKGAVRKLRAEEAAAIGEADDRIEETKESLRQARLARENLVWQAWARGNPVRLKELDVQTPPLSKRSAKDE